MLNVGFRRTKLIDQRSQLQVVQIYVLFRLLIWLVLNGNYLLLFLRCVFWQQLIIHDYDLLNRELQIRSHLVHYDQIDEPKLQEQEQIVYCLADEQRTFIFVN